MKFEDLFTTYNSIEPPDNYIDNIDNNVDLPDINFTQLPMVTTLDIPVTNIEDQSLGIISPFDLLIEDTPEQSKTNNKAFLVVNLARQFLNKPYVFGSVDPDKGFDCSGLINYVYKQIGIQLPRTSHAIAKVGTEVSLNNVLPGDIIYTSSKGPTGGHVKMVSNVSNGLIYVIEAKGRKWGIVESLLTNTSNIKSIRRILSSSNNIKQGDGKFINKTNFILTLNNTYRLVLQEHGLDPNYSYILTSSAAMESGWGTKVSGTYNYGGVKGKTGSVKSTIDWVNGLYIRRNQTFRDFNSVKDYCNYVVNLLSNKRYNAFNLYSASNPFLFWRHVLDAGYGGGDSAGKDKYMKSIQSIYKTVVNNAI